MNEMNSNVGRDLKEFVNHQRITFQIKSTVAFVANGFSLIRKLKKKKKPNKTKQTNKQNHLNCNCSFLHVCETTVGVYCSSSSEDAAGSLKKN